MEKQTELEIRAQAMINQLGAQRLQAMDQSVFFSAEIEVLKAQIVELQNQLASKGVVVDMKAEPALG
jgi:hypothetical protein